MKYRLYVLLRIWLTLMCKLSAYAAKKTKSSAALSALNFFIEKRGAALAAEARICMDRTRLWQSRAEKCIAAHHETSAVMKETAKKQSSV